MKVRNWSTKTAGKKKRIKQEKDKKKQTRAKQKESYNKRPLKKIRKTIYLLDLSTWGPTASKCECRDPIAGRDPNQQLR